MVEQAEGRPLARAIGMPKEAAGDWQDLLGDIRLTIQHHNTPNSGLLHVPTIDNLLRPHLQDYLHNQSIVTASNASTIAGSYDVPLENDALPRDKPVIIEISSDRSGAGKTQLLYHLTCLALLPESWNGINLEGKDGAVVFIDCDGRFDILRLAELIESYIKHRLSLALHFCESQKAARADNLQGLNSEDHDQDHEDGEIEEYLHLLLSIDSFYITELAEYVLTHLHVYQPASPGELLDILSSLPTYLTSSPSHTSHNNPLSLLIIDGISAFYWLQRSLSAPQKYPPNFQSSSADAPPILPQPQISLQSCYEAITSSLIKISTRFGANLILTNIQIPNANHTPATSTISSYHHGSTAGGPIPPTYPKHLPACYTYSPKFLSARIILSSDVVAPFHADIEVRDAWKERDLRMDVVQKAGVSAWVEGAGVRKGENRRDKAEGGWFWFSIEEEGVKIGADEEEEEEEEEEA
ncbi:hypothetical protein H072_1911 [Dactylellina haptotyla CBS 200.50]|uniref:Uncharacterized protein n=1 Tax=Dactylellina haptotyla (strain CBS 200.50) TaxID=1284197 RepID=S8BX27_DACHA|nr:hypothetical protein H072_1911 [Dactylellina haptotyla CBS 200.50]